MTISLPDVNVWVALAAGGHVHHVAARDWFAAEPAESIAFCRITQMGLLRLLTNARVMARSPGTIAQAWDVYKQLSADSRLVFAVEPNEIETTWHELMARPGVGPSSWTDAYLAAFACAIADAFGPYPRLTNSRAVRRTNNSCSPQ